MTDLAEPKVTASKNNATTGILLLRPPPESWTMTDWYRFEIAGVPFLLRNIINLQRGGLKRIVIYSHRGHEIDEDFRRRIAGDPRVASEPDWVSDPAQLAGLTGGPDDVLILDGSALHEKNEIATSRKNPGAIPIDIRQLEDLLGGKLEIERKGGRPFSFLPGADHSRILEERDLHAQHDRLLKTCGLSNDSFMDRLLTRSISRRLTHIFLATPLSPNQITLLSFVIGIAAAWCFFQGEYLTGMMGASFLILSAWIDCTDGEVARLKFMESEAGSKLDILSDNLVHFAVFFAIGMGLYYTTGNGVYKVLGGFAVLGSVISFAILSSFVVHKKSEAAAGSNQTQQKKSLADQLANRDFIYFLLLMAMIDRLDIFISVTAVGANVFAVYLIYSKIHSRAATEKSFARTRKK
ncbi:MAG: CDP-alcohol phosphatidyltransferase family protein [Nitrospinaceae bacterium]